MSLLALDTCTERMIVALRSGGPEEVDQWINLDSKDEQGLGNHARDLLPALEKLLDGRKPEVLGVALGPGSFTGVRIGLATAKGLAEGWGIPLIGLDNLHAMADAWRRLVPSSKMAVLPVIDARKKKFYGTLETSEGVLIPASDLSAESWLHTVRTVWTGPVVLSGYQGALMSGILGTQLPSDWTVMPVNDWTPGLLDQLEQKWRKREILAPNASPLYLRLSEAEENLRLRSS